jgi:hypothetical protein
MEAKLEEPELKNLEQNILVQNKKHSQNKKNLRRKTFLQKVVDEFIKEYPDETIYIQREFYKPNDYEKKLYTDACEELLNFLLLKLASNAKMFDDNILQRMYNGIKNSIILLEPNNVGYFGKKYKNVIQL